MAKQNCKTCKWIKNHCNDNEDPKDPVGGLIKVGEKCKWRVNHYQGSDAILGWLALQPVEHQPTLDLLSEESFNDLGSALVKTQNAMKTVWECFFRCDRLERIHVVSFMESNFDKYDCSHKQVESYHLHFFLIPRSKKLGQVIQRRLPSAPDVIQYVPWDDYLISNRIRSRDDRDLVCKKIKWKRLEKYLKRDCCKVHKNDWENKVKEFMCRLKNEL
jgi:hypothetical protein